ncbi:hypothetical protein GCM10023147_08730 [Tsukamurella soli]|uniref:Uncharacterized protein n=1 Tax=Tsukamurella soli TaxID=644556 RepID=A0ABP8J6S4_9ACTN
MTAEMGVQKMTSAILGAGEAHCVRCGLTADEATALLWRVASAVLETNGGGPTCAACTADLAEAAGSRSGLIEQLRRYALSEVQ